MINEGKVIWSMYKISPWIHLCRFFFLEWELFVVLPFALLLVVVAVAVGTVRTFWPATELTMAAVWEPTPERRKDQELIKMDKQIENGKPNWSKMCRKGYYHDSIGMDYQKSIPLISVESLSMALVMSPMSGFWRVLLCLIDVNQRIQTNWIKNHK